MKKSLLIIFIFGIGTAAALGQKGKTAPAKTTLWKQTVIAKHGVQSLSLPGDLIAESESVNPASNKDVSWTKYYKTWRRKGKRPLEVNIIATNWNVNFSVAAAGTLENATPQKLMALNLMADANNPNVEKSDFYEVDGVNGILTAGRYGESKDRIILIWSILREVDGKAQEIMLSVVCQRSDLLIAQKIIDSINIQK